MSALARYGAGLIVVIVALLVPRQGNASRAQLDACPQPAADACPLPIGTPVSAVLSDPNKAHVWRLAVQSGAALLVTLTNLAADYDLHIYDGDGTLLAESQNEGLRPDVVLLQGIEAGDYLVYVNSARGEASELPYSLLASPFGSTVVADADSMTASRSLGQPESAATATPKPTLAAGQVLVADDFSDPLLGAVRATGGMPPGAISRYEGGEYVLKTTTPQTGWAALQVPGAFRDASLIVDVRIVGDSVDRGVDLNCRQGQGWYTLSVSPGSGGFYLYRNDWKDGKSVNLVNWHSSPAIKPGTQVNHIELTCIGDTISAAINEVQVASVRDTTYTIGVMGVSVWTLSNSGTTVEGRLTNLMVIQR